MRVNFTPQYCLTLMGLTIVAQLLNWQPTASGSSKSLLSRDSICGGGQGIAEEVTAKIRTARYVLKSMAISRSELATRNFSAELDKLDLDLSDVNKKSMVLIGIVDLAEIPWFGFIW